MKATQPDHTTPKSASPSDGAFFTEACEHILLELRSLETEYDELRTKLIVAGIELDRRPKLDAVLAVLEHRATMAPTLVEGNALREAASELRKLFGGGA